MATDPRRPEDVPEELTSIALDVWHAACHAGRTNLEAMTALLTAVLPVHDAARRRDAFVEQYGATPEEVEARRIRLTQRAEAAESIAATCIALHEQVVMDTPEDRARHAEAITTMKNALAASRAGARPDPL